MMCPYCSEPMTKGYIPAHKQDIVWYPDGEKPDLFGSESPNSVPLAQWELFRGAKAVAYCCTDCKKVVIDAL